MGPRTEALAVKPAKLHTAAFRYGKGYHMQDKVDRPSLLRTKFGSGEVQAMQPPTPTKQKPWLLLRFHNPLRNRSVARHEAASSELSSLKGRGLRIIHISEAPAGGVVTHLEEILGYQAASGNVESLSVLVADDHIPRLEQCVPDNVRLIAFARNGRSVQSLLRLARATRKALREENPDIVHLHSTFAGIVVRLCVLGRRRRPKIIYCPHGWAFKRKSSFGSSTLERLAVGIERQLSAVTDLIICVSEAEKKAAVEAGISEQKCVVIRNGVADAPARKTLVLDAGRNTPVRLKILFVGRFDYQKGFDIYLEVMSRLGDVAEGLAVGDFVVGKTKPLDVPTNVSVLGWLSRERIQELYLESDLILMPSRSEGLPFVATEAMRAGLPVFAAKVGGNPEVVIDLETGRLFSPDNPEEIVEQIRSTSKDALVAYGIQARQRFLDYFTATAMNRKIFEEYCRLACT
jgi:glycosyltransferase involved in cell wall biosynthesis